MQNWLLTFLVINHFINIPKPSVKGTLSQPCIVTFSEEYYFFLWRLPKMTWHLLSSLYPELTGKMKTIYCAFLLLVTFLTFLVSHFWYSNKCLMTHFKVFETFIKSICLTPIVSRTNVRFLSIISILFSMSQSIGKVMIHVRCRGAVTFSYLFHWSLIT